MFGCRPDELVTAIRRRTLRRRPILGLGVRGETRHESWEVDALPPNMLSALIRNAFEEIVESRGDGQSDR